MEKINNDHHGYNYTLVQQYIHLIDKFKNKDDYVVLDRSVIPSGAYGYFGTGQDGYSGSKFLDRKALRENSQCPVKEKSLREIKSYTRQAANKESFIGFTRQSYKPAMEKILGPIEVLKLSGKFMVWRSKIISTQHILSQ